MKKVLNFSHPLSQEGKKILAEMLDDEVEVVRLPVQIDLNQSVKPQIDQLVELAFRHSPFDAIVPPGLAAVAGPLTARLSYAQSDAMLPWPPATVVVARTGTPPQFLPIEVMHW